MSFLRNKPKETFMTYALPKFESPPPPPYIKPKPYCTIQELIDDAHKYEKNGEIEVCKDVLRSLVSYVCEYVEKLNERGNGNEPQKMPTNELGKNE